MNLGRWIGRFFVLFNFAGAATCGYLLYKELHSQNAASSYPQAGVILFKNKEVQRKPSDLLVWNKLNQHDPVYWYDAIQTGEESSAVVYVKKGIFLKLSPSSLIQLDRSNDQLSINVQSGQLDADLSKAPSSTELLINGRNLTSTLGGSKKATLVVEGNDLAAYRRNADGTTTKVKMRKSGLDLTTESIPATLLFPAPHEELHGNAGKTTLPFFWNSRRSAPTFIEVSTDASFKSPLLRQAAKGGTYQAKLSLGHYFWRIRFVENKKIYTSEVRSFALTDPGGTDIADRLLSLRKSLLKKMDEPPLPVEHKPAPPPPPVVKVKPKVEKKEPPRKLAAVEPEAWTIQAALYFQENLASQKVNELRAAGFSPYYEQQGRAFAVNIGLFNSQQEAAVFLDKIKAKIQDTRSFSIVKTQN